MFEINIIALSKSFIHEHILFFFHWARKFDISTVKKICSNIRLRHSLSLSNFFNSDNESLNLVFSLKKMFDRDNYKGVAFPNHVVLSL
jgi:hypothetical protein